MGKTVPGTRSYHHYTPISTTEISYKRTSEHEFEQHFNLSKAVQVINDDAPLPNLNDFVACRYDTFWWVGIVDEIEAEKKDFKIKFMHPHGPSKRFSWPERDDSCWVPINNMIAVIGVPTTRSGRIYEIDIDDFNKVILARILDGSRFHEFKKEYGSSLVSGFGFIEGQLVGMLSNIGPLECEDAQSGAHFILMCNMRNIPLIFLQNSSASHVLNDLSFSGTNSAVIKDRAKMISALSTASVPKITINIGGCYGDDNYTMCGQSFDPNFMFVWPGAESAVSWKPANEEIDLKENPFIRPTSSFYSCAHVLNDGVIYPKNTRKNQPFNQHETLHGSTLPSQALEDILLSDEDEIEIDQDYPDSDLKSFSSSSGSYTATGKLDLDAEPVDRKPTTHRRPNADGDNTVDLGAARTKSIVHKDLGLQFQETNAGLRNLPDIITNNDEKQFVTETPEFPDVMDRDRFLAIWAFLHVVDEQDGNLVKLDMIGENPDVDGLCSSLVGEYRSSHIRLARHVDV
ncbi:Methylcrotonoyl-CoA carboxylase beta chain, mitochondrial [Nymphon striatum]|nr:Methylcrotonoyl-CoA carboxylase beta chain, mitochondrial [Nymphon striatum]